MASVARRRSTRSSRYEDEGDADPIDFLKQEASSASSQTQTQMQTRTRSRSRTSKTQSQRSQSGKSDGGGSRRRMLSGKMEVDEQALDDEDDDVTEDEEPFLLPSKPLPPSAFRRSSRHIYVSPESVMQSVATASSAMAVASDNAGTGTGYAGLEKGISSPPETPSPSSPVRRMYNKLVGAAADASNGPSTSSHFIPTRASLVPSTSLTLSDLSTPPMSVKSYTGTPGEDVKPSLPVLISGSPATSSSKVKTRIALSTSPENRFQISQAGIKMEDDAFGAKIEVPSSSRQPSASTSRSTRSRSNPKVPKKEEIPYQAKQESNEDDRDIIDVDDLPSVKSVRSSASSSEIEVKPSLRTSSRSTRRQARTVNYAEESDGDVEEIKNAKSSQDKGKRKTAVSESDSEVAKPSLPKRGRLSARNTKGKARASTKSDSPVDDDNEDDSDDEFVPDETEEALAGIEADSDVEDDHGAFEHISDFEGDDDDLDSADDAPLSASRAKKRLSAKSKAPKAAKGKKGAASHVFADNVEEEDAMLQDAIAASVGAFLDDSSTSTDAHWREIKRKRDRERKAAAEVKQKVKLLEKEEVKRLKRKLTQGEKNSLMLTVHHPELRDVWGDLAEKIKPVKPVPMEAHPSLKLTLLPFQKESLYWMKKQEEGPWKGGMLADEMGMGKTIQTIALLLSEPRRKPSLVVAPVVALMQWKNEIETHAEGFTVCLWHGSGRIKEEQLKKFDVVLVSYGTLEASFRKQQKGFKRGLTLVKEKSPMHSFQWNRIILDEAHNIKERSTNAAKAAFALDARYRWCLSGTPLQNRVGELYSLIRFLGGDPFAFYYCKYCPCKSLHWSFSNRSNCDDCGHSPMQHVCFWNNEILTPIQNYAMSGPGQAAFKKLKILLDRMMLRRTKIERADDLGLPPRTITVRRDFFSPEEKELYLSLFSATQRQFSTYISEGTVLNNYSNIFSLITRMRQMACHPDLVLRSKQTQFVPQKGEEIVCRICNDIADDAIAARCGHIFDRECIRQYLDMQNLEDPDCPVCHVGISIDLEAEAIETDESKKLKRQGILGRLDLNNWRSSTKLEALVEELSSLREKDATVKSLVFSQFVSFLDLIAFRLQRAGFTICRLEGGMTPQARDATIQHFMKNTHVSVMLISLKAGGVALNLTEASRVYLMDSWWNPSVERQAMDRIHRLGQHRSVEVIKLVVEDSIENRIVQLQEKKLAMTEAALARDPESALGKLTPEDLSFLFKL